jgi:hypothetical protein
LKTAGAWEGRPTGGAPTSLVGVGRSWATRRRDVPLALLVLGALNPQPRWLGLTTAGRSWPAASRAATRHRPNGERPTAE